MNEATKDAIEGIKRHVFSITARVTSPSIDVHHLKDALEYAVNHLQTMVEYASLSEEVIVRSDELDELAVSLQDLKSKLLQGLSVPNTPNLDKPKRY